MAMTMIIALLVTVAVMARDIVVVTDTRIVRVEDIVIDIFAATIATVVSYGQGKNP